MLGKKTEEKTRTPALGTALPPPLQRGERPPSLRHMITLERVENGWTIEELHSRRSAVAKAWPEALAWATAFSGEGTLQQRMTSFSPVVELRVVEKTK